MKTFYDRYRLQHTSQHELRRGSRSIASHYQARNGQVTGVSLEIDISIFVLLSVSYARFFDEISACDVHFKSVVPWIVMGRAVGWMHRSYYRLYQRHCSTVGVSWCDAHAAWCHAARLYWVGVGADRYLSMAGCGKPCATAYASHQLTSRICAM